MLTPSTAGALRAPGRGNTMSRILLMAESGSDITPELAGQLGVTIVPMHVTFAGETRDDGAFPVTQMFEHYKATHEPPRTSGCTPHDFEVAFGRVLAENPGAQILYLAYSACTTCSMQSAVMVADGREDIRIIDTKSVSAGQMAVVMRVAKALQAHPEMTLDEAAAIAKDAIAKVRMGFIPGDLDYLRAGGRVSNAAYLGAKILGLHPLIEIQDGKLISTKKYRGSMARVIAQMAREFPEQNGLGKGEIHLIYGDGLAEDVRHDAERILTEKGYQIKGWVRTGCVIAAHSGPGSFGIVGFAE